jgi:hypothetical protein
LGLLFLGTLAVAALIGSSAGAGTQLSAPPKIDVSTNASVLKYLNKLGIDTKGFVIQRGAKNYRGLACPGRAWNCTRSLKVVQIAAAGTNQFVCTASTNGGGFSSPPGECEVVQLSFSGASNRAYCIEKTSADEAEQNCTIRQSTNGGHNWASITQTVDSTYAANQSARQYAGVNQQTSNGGSNVVEIYQAIKQSTTRVMLGEQNQEGHQAVGVRQDTSGGGNNVADVTQTLSQQATATGPVVQNQNTENELNTSAGIEQYSDHGNNSADLQQTNTLNALAKRNGPVFQTQGSPDGGLLGHFEQFSDGISVVDGTQNETQTAHFDGRNSEPVTQIQYGPMSFGSSQFDNEHNRYVIGQRSTQQANRDSFQGNEQYGNCDTSGLCTATQYISQDGAVARNSCEGQSCHIGQTVTDNGEGTSTVTCAGLTYEGDEFPPPDPCPTPPPPPSPPPPVFGD